MKKFILFLSAVCMCLSAAVMLTSCNEDHTHTYKSEWVYDKTYHWHECEGESCAAVSEKSEHTWDEGTVTDEANAASEGKKTYKCTVCNATKDESVVFAGISEEKWNAMISPAILTNYTVEYGGIVTQTGSGMNMVSEQSFVLRFNEDKCYAYGTVKPEGAEQAFEIVNGIFIDEGYIQVKETYEAIFLSILANYKNYKYNSVDNVYEIPDSIEVTVNYGESNAIISVSNSIVSVSDDGKLLKLVCEYSQTEEGIYTATSKMTYIFKDYGTTLIPEADE